MSYISFNPQKPHKLFPEDAVFCLLTRDGAILHETSPEILEENVYYNDKLGIIVDRYNNLRGVIGKDSVLDLYKDCVIVYDSRTSKFFGFPPEYFSPYLYHCFNGYCVRRHSTFNFALFSIRINDIMNQIESKIINLQTGYHYDDAVDLKEATLVERIKGTSLLTQAYQDYLILQRFKNIFNAYAPTYGMLIGHLISCCDKCIPNMPEELLSYITKVICIQHESIIFKF